MNALAFNVLAGILSSVAFVVLVKMVMAMHFLRKYVEWTGEREALRVENSIWRITPLDMPEWEGTMPSSDPNLLRGFEQGNGLVGRMKSDVSISDPGNRSDVHDAAGINAGLVDAKAGFTEA